MRMNRLVSWAMASAALHFELMLAQADQARHFQHLFAAAVEYSRASDSAACSMEATHRHLARGITTSTLSRATSGRLVCG